MPPLLLLTPILLAALYLLTLGVATLVSPDRTRQFLSSFASSAFAHFLELSIRLILGAVLILYAPQMKFPILFQSFGWILVVTTVVLALLPWRWHSRFARWSVPLATRNMPLLALGSFAIAGAILLSVFGN